MPASSSSSADRDRVEVLAPGTTCAGFTIKRLLGEGPRGAVYEATQEGLERRVALKVYSPDPQIADRFRALRWPEHPHVVSLYAAGVCEHGFFTATRLVDGPSLAQLCTTRRLDSRRAAQLCDQIGLALEAAHADGIAHGAMSLTNVFVASDGRALLTDFVAATGDVSAASDRAALAQIRRLCDASAGGGSLRRVARPLGLALVLVAVVAAIALATLPSESVRPAAPPPPTAGVATLGSTLTATNMRSVDCQGERPSGSSPACTITQTRLPGSRLSVPEDGAIRGWVVRGARGGLRLQVLRDRAGRYTETARSQIQRVPDTAFHALRADLPVRRGDRIGIELVPGAAVGVSDDRPGTATERFMGPVHGERVRRPTRSLPARLDTELLVRVDYAPGAAPAAPATLTGEAAARAPAGRLIVQRDVDVAEGHRSLRLVSLEGATVLDLLAGDRRLARVPLGDAKPRGHLFKLSTLTVGRVEVTWSNPDGTLIEHDYVLTSQTLKART